MTYTRLDAPISTPIISRQNDNFDVTVLLTACGRAVVGKRLGAHTVASGGDVTATLKVHRSPGTCSCISDDKYVGHASELGGAIHSLSISPGKHRIKVELPGYRSFETEVDLLAGQKSELKTELVKGASNKPVRLSNHLSNV